LNTPWPLESRFMVTRKSVTEFRSYPLVRIFLKELILIEQVMQQLKSSDSEILVETETWTAKTLQELKDADPQEMSPRKLSITCVEPTLSISIERGSLSKLYAGDINDLRVRGAVDKIDSILKECKAAPFARFFGSTRGWAVILLLGVIINGILILGNVDNAFVTPGMLAFIAVGFAGSTIGVDRLSRKSSANLFNREIRIGFFRRNKDRIILGIFFTALGAALTWLGTRLSQH